MSVAKGQRKSLSCPWCKPEGEGPRQSREAVLRENKQNLWQAAGNRLAEFTGRELLRAALKSRRGEGVRGGKLS